MNEEVNFKGIDSQRGIAWRCDDRLSLKVFLNLEPIAAAPDHSSLTKIGDRLPTEVYREVFPFVLRMVHERGLLKGQAVGVDSTLLEANAAMKSIVRKDSGDDWEEYLTTGKSTYRSWRRRKIDLKSKAELIRFDKERNKKDGGKKVSNADWQSPSDPNARIAKMKDGTTHLVYKSEHAVDLDAEVMFADPNRTPPGAGPSRKIVKMADALRSKRLEWLHARYLKAADKIPGATFVALRADDELLDDVLNGRSKTFPISLLDFDWEEHAPTLSVIAFVWKMDFAVTPEVSARIDQYFDRYSAGILDITSGRPMAKMQQSGFWMPHYDPTSVEEADDPFGFHKNWEELRAAVERQASQQNLRKWAIQAFTHFATGRAVRLPPARYGHFTSVKLNDQSWVAVMSDRRALPSEEYRQQLLIELRLDQIWTDACNDFKERKLPIDVALTLSKPSEWSFGSVSVCLMEENLFIAYARALEMLANKEDVIGTVVAECPGDETDECERYVDPLTPAQKKIIRFLWSRKHATTFQTLIDLCWDNKNVAMATVSRALERIGKCWMTANLNDISLRISKADCSVKLVKPDKSADKKTDSTVG